MASSSRRPTRRSNNSTRAASIATPSRRSSRRSANGAPSWPGSRPRVARPRHPDSAHERLSVGSGTDADRDSHPRGRDEAAEDASSDVDRERRRVVDDPPQNRRRRRARSPSAIAGCPSMLSIVSGPRRGSRRGGSCVGAAAAAARDASVAAAKPSSIPVSRAGRSILVCRFGRLRLAARFNFDDLCGARARLGAADYVALLDRFDLIAVDGVPTFGPEDEDVARRRLVNLVDVLYERRALLVASLAAAPVDLFRGDNDADGERETVREATRGRVRARRARGEGTARRSPEKGAAAGDRRLSWGTWNGPPRVALGRRWRICRGSTSRSGRHGGASPEADGDGERGLGTQVGERVQ